MRVKVLGKYWNFRFVSNLGLDKDGNTYLGHCDHPDNPHKAIKIKYGQPLKEEFDTVLHETLHILFPQADEEFVEQSASDITHILFKLYEIKRKDRKSE